MVVDPLGESAAILRDLPCPASVAAVLVGRVMGVVEAYAAFDTVGVVFEGTLDEKALQEALSDRRTVEPGRSHSIPVLYDGEDLAEVAARTGLSIEGVVRFHAREYECHAVGFCPGFAYLAPLPREIDLPRRESPRPRIDPGSVALAAGMTAVYPLGRPGGWWIVGRTPLTLVDEADGYFPIRAGDRVRFVSIGPEEFVHLNARRL